MKKIVLIVFILVSYLGFSQLEPKTLVVNGAIINVKTTAQIQALAVAPEGYIQYSSDTQTLWIKTTTVWKDTGVSGDLSATDIDTLAELNAILTDATLVTGAHNIAGTGLTESPAGTFNVANPLVDAEFVGVGINPQFVAPFSISNDIGAFSLGTNNQIEMGSSGLGVALYGESVALAKDQFVQIYVEETGGGGDQSDIVVGADKIIIGSESVVRIEKRDALGVTTKEYRFDGVYNTANDVPTKADVDSAISGVPTGTDDQTLSEVLTQGSGAGSLGITGLADILPDANATRNLGSPTFKWLNGYISTLNFTSGLGSSVSLTGSLALDTYLDFAATDVEPSALEGRTYADNSENRPKYYDGTSWKAFILDGDVVGTDDQTATEVPFTPYSTIASTNTQAAIQELLDEGGAGITTAQTNRIANENYFSFRNPLSETPTDVAWENTTSGNEGKKVLNYADASEDITITLDGTHVEGKSYTYFTKTGTSQITISPSDATISDALILKGATGTENTLTLSAKGQSATVIKTDVANEYFVTGDGTLTTTTFASGYVPASQPAAVVFNITADEQAGADESLITAITDYSPTPKTISSSNMSLNIDANGDKSFKFANGGTDGVIRLLQADADFSWTDDMTMMFRPGEVYPIGAIYADGSQAGGREFYLIPSTASAGGVYGVGFDAGGFLTTPQPPWDTAALNNNTDLTYFFTYDGTTKVLTFMVFEDGDATASYVSSTTLTATADVVSSGGDILIGQEWADGTYTTFNTGDKQTGYIEHVIRWNVKLTPAEADAVRLGYGW